jgi:transposase
VEAQDLARAQKKCAAERRLIVFIDESGLSERPTRVRTWAPRGCTPVVQFHFNWKHVSAIAGLTRTNFLFRLYDGAVKSAQIVEFLKALRSQLKRRLLIVWDGAAQHKSRIVRDYLDSTKGAIQMALLPGYAPDLNPVEYLWAWLKRHALANFCPNSLAELKTTARNKLRSGQRRHRSSPHAGSRLSCGDVMGYVILNRRCRQVGELR